MKRKTARVSIQSTDSMELIVHALDKKGRNIGDPWFWVPETGMLRKWRQSMKDALTVKTRPEVERIVKEAAAL